GSNWSMSISIRGPPPNPANIPSPTRLMPSSRLSWPVKIRPASIRSFEKTSSLILPTGTRRLPPRKTPKNGKRLSKRLADCNRSPSPPCHTDCLFSYSHNDLYCEQVPLVDLAASVGTPAYVYSSQGILGNYRAYHHAFGDLAHIVCYSVKSNSSLAVLS